MYCWHVRRHHSCLSRTVASTSIHFDLCFCFLSLLCWAVERVCCVLLLPQSPVLGCWESVPCAWFSHCRETRDGHQWLAAYIRTSSVNITVIHFITVFAQCVFTFCVHCVCLNEWLCVWVCLDTVWETSLFWLDSLTVNLEFHKHCVSQKVDEAAFESYAEERFWSDSSKLTNEDWRRLGRHAYHVSWQHCTTHTTLELASMNKRKLIRSTLIHTILPPISHYYIKQS